MTLRVWGIFFSFCLLSAQVTAAQVRQITGRVTNSSTEQGLTEATIAVSGTGIVAVTNNEGNYVLNAPDGDQTLVVRAIGYKHQQVPVSSAQSTADVALEPDVFKLEEIVITGQATGVERQNLPNAVATVSGEELNRAPAQTIESSLQGKIPGAYIQANSGAPGGGFQLSLRGVSTINGSVDPLYVVDGVVVSNAAIPNGQNAVSCAQCGATPQPGQPGQPHCRPESRRHRAHRGAEGRVCRGDLRLQGHQRGRDHHYEAGAGGQAAVQHLPEGGCLLPGQYPRLADLRHPRRGPASSRHRCSSLPLFQPAGRSFRERAFGHKPLSYETNASVSGGTENTKYYISGLVKDDERLRSTPDTRSSPCDPISTRSWEAASRFR